MPAEKAGVIIVGGGPCGLMLANELGRRGVSAVLIDEKSSTAFNPQANATQARTMEHFRRLGFAREIRKAGLPPDFPTDIAYFTRFARYELGRFRLPSAREATQRVSSMSGAWSAAELPHRVSQKFVEAELRRQAEQFSSVAIHFGMRMAACRDQGDHVEVEVEDLASGKSRSIQGQYLVGADGARSKVRQYLGFRYAGETGVRRDFMGGRMYAIYAYAPEFYEMVPHDPAWMNVTFNTDRRAFMAAVDGKGEFAFHTQLHSHEDEERITEDDARAMFQAAAGAEIPVRILSRGGWTAGHCLVAEHFQRGRILIGGDAAHLFTPTGGLGYNTAVEDAVNLGWKLASVIKGIAPPALLDSYETERRPLAIRNTGYARQFADSLGLFKPVPEIEDDSPAGALARQQAGEYLASHGRAEFNIPGITFGGRYDGSPIIVGDGSAAPPDAANQYIPTACPGGRPPHLWLPDGSSLFDHFHAEWTLLRMGPHSPDALPFVMAAAERGMDLKVVDFADVGLRELYAASLALIRPDQIVAWRGNHADHAGAILDAVLGKGGGAAKPAAIGWA